MENRFKGVNAYLVIPVEIAHDPEFQKSNAALIFGEIWAALNAFGEFSMSNSDLAKLYHCSEETIRRDLVLLENRGLIQRVKTNEPGTSRITRKIVLAFNPFGTTPHTDVYPTQTSTPHGCVPHTGVGGEDNDTRTMSAEKKDTP